MFKTVNPAQMRTKSRITIPATCKTETLTPIRLRSANPTAIPAPSDNTPAMPLSSVV